MLTIGKNLGEVYTEAFSYILSYTFSKNVK